MGHYEKDKGGEKAKIDKLENINGIGADSLSNDNDVPAKNQEHAMHQEKQNNGKNPTDADKENDSDEEMAEEEEDDNDDENHDEENDNEENDDDDDDDSAEWEVEKILSHRKV